MLKPGTPIYEEMRQLWFNDEESDEAHIVGEIMQLAFNGMEIGQIEKEYGKVERLAEADGQKIVNVFN